LNKPLDVRKGSLRMPIDIHAHYVPKALLERIAEQGSELGVRVESPESAKTPLLAFAYGFKTRPLFPKLIEPTELRLASLKKQGIDRQMVATWPDIYGYGLKPDACVTWHRLLNDTLSDWCRQTPDHFSFVASLPLNDVAASLLELERVLEKGAVSVMIPANLEGVNIGECELDPLWRRAEEIKVPVQLHPVSLEIAARTSRFGLTQIAQYTFDTTLAIGSLIFSGVLDRFPNLSFVLPHAGGTFPYLLGRFDIMHKAAPRAVTGDVAMHEPSAYASRFSYDTILHSPKALRFLADAVGIDQLALGTDESFPPADLAALQTLRNAGFSPAEIRTIAETNPRRIFSRIPSHA
jgi:aminocarboxymuconate-semialdehyde decarboxylase